MNKVSNNPTLLIAGPGAGKTYNLVNKIKEQIKYLESYRYLVVITYTNAATNEIRTRLAKKISIPDNVFIGTIHSFMIRFILEPYGSVCLGLPNSKKYLDTNIQDVLEIKDSIERNKELKKINCIFERKGLISFNRILNLSKKILENNNVAELVSKRIKYLFIDEFQDANTDQFEVFERIRKKKYTEIYYVGDSEQYITGFQYKQLKRRIPDFNRIPFNKLKNNSRINILENSDNYRSSNKIVSFVNNFNTNLKQVNKKEKKNNDIYFFTNNDINSLLNIFNIMCDSAEFSSKDINKMVICRTEELNKKLSKELNDKATFLNNSKIKSKTEKLLIILSGLNKESFLDVYCSKDIINLSKYAMNLVKYVASSERNEEDIIEYIEKILKIEIDDSINKISTIKNYLSEIRDSAKSNKISYMNIHKSKGLEADAVLVIAEKKSYFKKWLEEDKEKRFKDKNDECRIGFVAFSRPKELLCIACLQQLDKDTMKKIIEYGIVPIDEEAVNTINRAATTLEV